MREILKKHGLVVCINLASCPRTVSPSTIRFVALCAALIWIAACSPQPAPVTEDPATQDPGTENPGSIMFFPPVPIRTVEQTPTSSTLLQNGSFEQDKGPLPWRIDTDGGASISLSGEIAADGGHSLRVAYTSNNEFEVSQELTLPSTGIYQLRGLALSESNPRPAYIGIRIKDAESDETLARTAPFDLRRDLWSSREVRFEASALVRSVTVFMICPALDDLEDTQGAFWLDSFTLHHIDVPPPHNFILNGGFEDEQSGVLDNWRYRQDTSSIKQGDQKVLGAHSLRIDIERDGNRDIRQPVRGLQSGQRYQISGYLKANNLSGRAGLLLRGSPSLRIATDTVSGTENWRWVKSEFTLPEDAADVTLYLRVWPQEGEREAGGSVWFDECELFALE